MNAGLEPIASSAVGLSELVYSRIGEAILDGRLPAGERLRDADLADALQVSRTPVREALQRLARIGLVEVAASRYTRVTSPSPALMAQTLEYTGYQAGISLRMALPRMTDAELAQTLELVDVMVAASDADEIQALYAASRALYRHVSVLTGNELFTTMMLEVGLALERNLRHSRPVVGTTGERGELYRRLREAIQQRDVERAEQYVRRQHGIRVDDVATQPAPASMRESHS